MVDWPEFRYLLTELFDDGAIARIMLNRPETRNAQNRGMLVELDQALAMAEADDDCRVVILGGMGPVFSSGHDMGSSVAIEERSEGEGQHPTYRQHGGTLLGGMFGETRYRQEWQFYLANTLRWRNLRKVTVCQVQGPAYLAAMMIAWACDLIVAAEDAVFGDMAATRFGNDHVEFFAHPWELGARRAKELLLTGDTIDADEAYRIGMVSRVFPTDQLSDLTLEFARRIARVPPMSALMIKEAVNQTVDIQGFTNAVSASFGLHHVTHSYWAERREDHRPEGSGFDGIGEWRQAPPPKRATRSEP
jgi:enoyl-CoA hydratase